MRSYTVATACFMLDVPVKWLDNILSRHDVPGVHQAGPRADRLISAEALDRLRILRALNLNLGITVPTGLAIAERVLANPDGGLPLGAGLELRLSHDRLRGELETRAAEASGAVHRRRGRPPAKS